jgi:hypothetical protein
VLKKTVLISVKPINLFNLKTIKKMTLNAFKNFIFLALLLSLNACGLDSNNRLNGEWKNSTLGFSVDFNVQNKTMNFRTGVTDISAKTSFAKINESGDVVNLIKEDGSKTVVTFKGNDEIELSTENFPIALSFSRVKKN